MYQKSFLFFICSRQTSTHYVSFSAVPFVLFSILSFASRWTLIVEIGSTIDFDVLYWVWPSYLKRKYNLRKWWKEKMVAKNTRKNRSSMHYTFEKKTFSIFIHSNWIALLFNGRRTRALYVILHTIILHNRL